MSSDYQAVFQDARQAAAKGDYHTSRKLYSKLWKSPIWRNDKDVQLNYAYSCERTGDYTEALTAYKSLMEHYSGNLEGEDQALAEESLVRLRELMEDGESKSAGKIIDKNKDEEEAFLISQLFAHGYVRDLKAGEPLCLKGESAGHMWLLQDGALDVVIPGQITSKLTGSESRPCLVGELAYFTGMRRAATLTCASQIKVLELPYERIRALLNEDEKLYAMMDHLFRHRLVFQILAKHDIFKLFNEVDRRRVTSIFVNTLTQPGQILIEQDEEYSDAYLMQSGTMLMIKVENGEEHFIGSMHPGDLFHLSGLLRGFKSPYRVISGTPCHLLRLPRNSFEPFMMQRPWLIKAILKQSRMDTDMQVLHPEAKNLWATDRYIDMDKPSS
ncbi:MAG: cyclic nucleotide-binding domain-containing protein [Mariprofundaceae bacterium]